MKIIRQSPDYSNHLTLFYKNTVANADRFKFLNTPPSECCYNNKSIEMDVYCPVNVRDDATVETMFYESQVMRN